MQAVDMGEWGGKDNWDNCIVKPEQECADPKKTSWVKSEVFTIATDNFKNTAGKDGMDYLKKESLSRTSYEWNVSLDGRKPS